MFKNFHEHINKNFSFLNESKLLIAISGGLDSIVLTHVCQQTNLNISLAHCNFNLRGKESDGDENFVLQIAEDLDIEVFVESFETEVYAHQNKLSAQMAARELRYNWFEDLANQLHFDYILTAHHADDNLETFLINLTRGTGLDGLIGIPEINGNIIRPLLKFSRVDIEAYAKENKLVWREDSSNSSSKYLRNKLRHEVVPKLKEINPQLLQNFGKTLGYLKDSNTIIEDRIEAVSNTIINHVSDTEIHFNLEELLKLNNPKPYLFQLLKDYKFTEWNDVTNLLESQSGKYVLSETHRLLKDRNALILSSLNSNISSSEVDNLSIEFDTNQIETSFGVLNFETVNLIGEINESTIYVDKDLLKFPLKVRQWQKADYFYPFGMQGKKKLSKFFKDEKLSLLDKENVWLLCSENDIVWILNMRLDNRFKVSDKTNSILKITLQ